VLGLGFGWHHYSTTITNMVKKKLHMCFYTFEYKQSRAFAWPHCVFSIFYLLLCFIVPFITSFIASLLLCFSTPFCHCSVALLFLCYILVCFVVSLLYLCFQLRCALKKFANLLCALHDRYFRLLFYLPLLFHYFALGCFSHLH
jgi:hypothetical protein